MLAVDTNIVVRFLTKDDPRQSPKARDLLSQNDTWLGATVMLETEWVLRSIYHYGPAEVSAALRSLGGLPRLQIEDAEAVKVALGHHDLGMDFADALHVVRGPRADAFVTFDKPFIEVGTRLGLPVRAP
jgi:predicted nucleic-acid-binding protein